MHAGLLEQSRGDLAALVADPGVRALLDSLPDGVFVKDLEGRYVLANAAVGRFLQAKPVQILGRTDEQLMDPDTGRKVRADDRLVMDRCESMTFETRVEIGGVRRTFLTSKAPYFNADGRLAGVIGISRDMTERARDDEQLSRHRRELQELLADRKRFQEEHALLASIVEGSDDAIISKDLHGIIRSWNPGAQRLYGYTAAQAIGQPIAMLLPPELIDQEQRIFRQLRAGDRIESFRSKRRRKDGKIIDVSLTMSPIHDAMGQVIGASKIARDIGHQVRAEQRVSRINRLLKALLQASPVAIVAVDPDSTVRMWNRAAQELLGWTEKEVLGRPIPILPDDKVQEGRSLRQAVVREGRAIVGLETVRRRKDGALLDVRVSAAPLTDSRGQPIAMMVMIEDIAERKKAERALLESEDRLRRQHEALAQLARGRDGGDLQATLERITRTAASTLRVERASVWLYNEQRTAIRCAALYELSQDRHSCGIELSALDYPAYFQALEAERVVAAADARTDPRTREFTDGYLDPLGISSMMDAGVLVHGRLAGVVCHEHTGPPRRWMHEERAFAASVADMVAAALESDQRRRAEEALRDSERFKEQILQSSNDCIKVLSLDGRLQYMSPGGQRLMELQCEDYQDRDWLEFWPPEHRPAAQAAIAAASAGAVGKFQGLCPTGSGKPRWWDVIVTPIIGHDGRPERLLSMSRDITEARRAEESLREHAHTLNTLNRISSTLNSELDPDTLVQTITEAGAELTGARTGAFFRIDDGGALAPYGPRAQGLDPGLPPIECALRSAATGSIVNRPDILEGALENGSRPPIRSLLAAAVISREGKPIGTLVFGHPQPGAFDERAERLIGGLAAHAAVAIDNAQLFARVQKELDERIQAEEELARLNATLETRVQERTAELDRRMSQLRALAAQVHRVEQRERARLARVLHDHLQQLLVAAMIQLDLAGKGRGRTARKVAEQAGRLVREAIEVSRSLTADLSPPVLYEGSMSSALNWLARHMGDRHSLEVQVQAPDEDSADGLSEERRVLLFQSVRELLFNVVKHAGVQQASVRMVVADDRVEVTVEDLGHGLPSSALSGPMTSQGTGFGLMSMRERLEYVGGALTVDSRPEAYTRVTVSVPLESAQTLPETLPETPALTSGAIEADESGALPVIEPPSRRRTARKKIRVLLSDDHKVLRDGLAGLLRTQTGIEVVGEASNGLEAVDLATRLRPDVIVMDISMPVLNGIEATRRITQQYPGTRIVGLSMHEESDMTAAMLEAGAEAYLTKGGPAEDLIAAIYGKPAQDSEQPAEHATETA